MDDEDAVLSNIVRFPDRREKHTVMRDAFNKAFDIILEDGILVEFELDDDDGDE